MIIIPSTVVFYKHIIINKKNKETVKKIVTKCKLNDLWQIAANLYNKNFINFLKKFSKPKRLVKVTKRKFRSSDLKVKTIPFETLKVPKIRFRSY